MFTSPTSLTVVVYFDEQTGASLVELILFSILTSFSATNRKKKRKRQKESFDTATLAYILTTLAVK